VALQSDSVQRHAACQQIANECQKSLPPHRKAFAYAAPIPGNDLPCARIADGA
jgi:hypothetical protein